MLRQIDISALRCVGIPEDRDCDNITWEAFYDEWVELFSDAWIYTSQLIDAIVSGKIAQTPREVRRIVNRKKSPVKALGITLRKMRGMMAANGNVLVDCKDSNKKINMWKVVRVDPSQHL